LSSGSVGCVKGQSSPEDVACGVLICLRSVPTPLAGELCLGDAVPFGDMPAGFATVGSMPRLDLDQCASSVFRFGAQNRYELAPGSVTNTSVQRGLSRRSVLQESSRVTGIRSWFRAVHHVRDRQGFDRDQVVGVDHLSRKFVVEVAALVRHLAVPGSNSSPGFRAVLGTGTPGRPHSKLVGPPHADTASHWCSTYRILVTASLGNWRRNERAVRTSHSPTEAASASVADNRTRKCALSSTAPVATLGTMVPAAIASSPGGTRPSRSRRVCVEQHTKRRPDDVDPLTNRTRHRGMTERYEAPPTFGPSGRTCAHILLTALAASTVKEH